MERFPLNSERHPSALTVGLDRRVAASLPEIKYTLRTLLRIAGYGCTFVWLDDGVTPDITYGVVDSDAGVLHIPAALHDFGRVADFDALGSRYHSGMPFVLFPRAPWLEAPRTAGRTNWPCDVVFAAFWFLIGARETTWRRDRWDNLYAHDWVPVRDGLLTEAPVSRWGRAIRDLFTAVGRPPLPMPWEAGPTVAAFSFTHDVDYPQIIRWIEAPRELLKRGPRAIGSAIGVLRGSNHFWTFREWIDFESKFGARPTFYFMARQGSLLQYALGRPDDFYDIRRPEFTRLFGELRDAGCEVGLHASYLAHRSAETIRAEAERVRHASGMRVLGNRHHFWHMDPENPNETLRRHELAGLQYDSSLGLEFFPGYRRGICHPFHPFHQGERRELGIVQVPPAWMDDHFDGRLAQNGITDPDTVAQRIVQTARETGGVTVVDYHSRGMNADIYPRWGPWLSRFAERQLDAQIAFRTPTEILNEYRSVESVLDSISVDETVGVPSIR
ncbi:MAG: hypothetical protein ABMA00_06040 [Gemmatimonas sp.]